MSARSVHRLDRLGTCVSGLCAVHCALMPIVLAALPVLGGSVLADPAWEWSVLGASSMIGTAALLLGRRQHKRWRPAGLFLLGMSLFLAARLWAHWHGDACCDHDAPAAARWPVALLSVAGGIGVVAAHLHNSRLCRCCAHA